MTSQRVLCALVSLTASLVGGLLTGCNDSNDPVLVTIQVSENPIQIASDQSSKAVVLDPGGPNVQWTITSNATYLTAAPSDGTGVTEIQVTVDRSKLMAGVTTGALQIGVPTARVKIPVVIAVAE